MTITFREAREAVRRVLNKSSSTRGYEDAEDYNVLVNPPFDDEIVLVRKADGEVHKEIALLSWGKTDAMTPVFDEEPFDGGTRLA